MALRIPRIPSGFPVVDPKTGTVTPEFQRWWQTMAQQIEEAINGIQTALEAAGIALDAADVALAAADSAQTAADNAQTAAEDAQQATDATQAETSIVNSYVANFVAPLISSDSLGNVTVATHDRVYGDPALNPTVSVTGDTIATGAAANDVVRIYYDDPARAGGAVSYQFTIDPAAPPVQGGDRHSVGAVSVPLAGTSDGREVQPPGYVILN